MTLTTDPADPATFPAPAAASRAAAVPSLRRNFSWTLAGNAIYAASQWGVLVVLAKWGSMEAVGQFAWGLAVTAPLMLLANLQLREVQATDARGQFRFGHYLALRLVCLAAALVAVAGLAAANRSDARTAAVVLLIGLAKAFDGLADVVYGLFQQRERMKPVSASLAVNGVVTLAAVAAAMLLAHSVVWAAAGSALGSAAALAFVAARAARGPGARGALRPAWDRDAAGQLLRIALPLGAVALLISLNSNLPRYFVEHYFGKALLGAFAAMAYLLVAGTTVTAALAQSCGPRLAVYYARGDLRAFRRLLGKMMAVGAVLGLGGLAVALVAGRQVLTLLYRPEYAFAARSFAWLMAAGAVAYVASFLNTAMVVVRALRPQTYLFALVITVDFLACAALVPSHGLTGAAWGAGLAFCVQLAGAYLIVASHLRRRAGPLVGRGDAEAAVQRPESIYADGEYLLHNPSWHVEDSPWKAGHVLTLLRRHGLSPKTVCEVGCGAGEVLRQLHDRMGEGVRFDGYDVSPQAHALAATRQTGRLRYHLRDAFDGPGETYDLVLALDVLEHVEDCFAFLRKLRAKGTYKVLHIPLDISAYSAVGPTLMRGRRAMGHVHYFTRATALATLEETGYEVVDWFYTPGFEAPGAPNERWAGKALKAARRAVWLVSPEACVRLLGGVSIAVLAK